MFQSKSMSSRIKARSKKNLFGGLSFKKSFKAKAGGASPVVDSAQAPGGDQALNVVDTAGGEPAAAEETPAPKQPFFVVSGMISLSGNVPSSASTDGGDSQLPGEEDASEVATGDLSAEVQMKDRDTATEAPDAPSATARSLDFDQAPGEVLRVGVAGSRSLSADDSPAGGGGGGSPPPATETDGVVPKPLRGDLAGGAIPESDEVVANALDASSRRDKVAVEGTRSSTGGEPSGEQAGAEAKPLRADLAVDAAAKSGDIAANALDASSRRDKEAEKNTSSTREEPSGEADAKASAAMKRVVPAGKKRYVVVSGYAQDSRSDKPGMKPAGDVDARPECVAEKTRGTSPSPEVKTLPKKPKKGLFNPVFGSSKALSKPKEPGDGRLPASSQDDGFLAVSDVSVDMGDSVSDALAGAGARMDGSSPATTIPPLKTPSPSLKTNKPKKALLGGSFRSSKTKPGEAKVRLSSAGLTKGTASE